MDYFNQFLIRLFALWCYVTWPLISLWADVEVWIRLLGVVLPGGLSRTFVPLGEEAVWGICLVIEVFGWHPVNKTTTSHVCVSHVNHLLKLLNHTGMRICSKNTAWIKQNRHHAWQKHLDSLQNVLYCMHVSARMSEHMHKCHDSLFFWLRVCEWVSERKCVCVRWLTWRRRRRCPPARHPQTCWGEGVGGLLGSPAWWSACRTAQSGTPHYIDTQKTLREHWLDAKSYGD